MKNKIVVSRPVVFLLFVVALMIFVVRPALALVDASSSPPTDDSSTTVSESTSTDAIVSDSASSTGAIVPDLASSGNEVTATSTESSTSTDEQGAATPLIQTPPAGLTEVHIIGTKYIDYFTDGTTVTSYPGDPAIDSHFSEPNAPIPTHEGLTWVHTVGQPLYDTSSGDLEVGDYAVQSDGSYIQNAPPFVSSTSTPESMQESTPIVTDASTTSSTQGDSVVQPATPSSDVPEASSTQDSTASPEVTPEDAADILRRFER
jgi:hypothetical protein